MDGEHTNADSLRTIIRAGNAQKQEVALAGDLTPSQLSNVLSGRRLGSDADLREAIARGLSEALGFAVHPRAITCHCADPSSHREVRG